MNPDSKPQFDHDGFVTGPRLLSGSELDSVRAAVDRILVKSSAGMDRLYVHRTSGEGCDRQIHVVGAWRAEEAIAALSKHPLIAAWVCALMGCGSVRLFRDQIFVKFPNSSGVVPWHQDYSDWVHTSPAAHITCWVALDSATIDSGCLHYVSGHPPGVLPKISRDDTHESAFARLPLEIQSNFRPGPVEVPAGGCVFHHCLTIHGSYGNRTPHARRAIAFAYMHPETRSTFARSIFPNGPTFAAGEIIAGPLFPVIVAAP